MVPSKLKALENTPVAYALGLSFHPVPSELQSVIHSRLGELGRLHGAEINKTRTTLLEESHRYFVAQWNCTVEGRSRLPVTMSWVNGADGAMPSTVQESAFVPKPAATTINGLCQKYISRVPPLRNISPTAGSDAAMLGANRADGNGFRIPSRDVLEFGSSMPGQVVVITLEPLWGRDSVVKVSRFSS